MEILNQNQYNEYNAFIAQHENSEFMQSTMWHNVKNNWNHEVIVSRDDAGKIVGGMSVLIQKVPLFNTTFLYAPRGPVCDWSNKQILMDLKSGVDELAKKYNSYLFKIDPAVDVNDENFKETMTEMGFTLFAGPDGFETIQARFNYKLYLNGRNEDEVFADLTQKTRYNIRVALKHNVEVKPVGKEYLDDFIKIMQVTGERDGFITRNKDYFERMMDSLGENVRLYIGFYDGKAVSGAITTNFGGKCCYVYGASDNEHRNVMPNYLMQWEMIKWAIEKNCYVYDFQGVSGDLTDETRPIYGLYRFKKGFNGQLDEYAGEFDYIYKPFMKKMVDLGVKVNKKLRKIKKSLKHN
ncbi:MAG: peptidoglycan bridge formation glycyltransferase FemA/FemB family protein [Oscillospiraceae bacterium]